MKNPRNLILGQLATATAIILFLNGWMATNTANDRAGVAMDAGLAVFGSLSICIVLAVLWLRLANRNPSNRALGCTFLTIWLISMFVALDAIWVTMPRFQ